MLKTSTCHFLLLINIRPNFFGIFFGNIFGDVHQLLMFVGRMDEPQHPSMPINFIHPLALAWTLLVA